MSVTSGRRHVLLPFERILQQRRESSQAEVHFRSVSGCGQPGIVLDRRLDWVQTERLFRLRIARLVIIVTSPKQRALNGAHSTLFVIAKLDFFSHRFPNIIKRKRRKKFGGSRPIYSPKCEISTAKSWLPAITLDLANLNFSNRRKKKPKKIKKKTKNKKNRQT